ncbi:L-lactate dehydrogenase [Pseudoclavibacter chungangensis]|uniref:L-lactate dehydrogenase n=1 Tax=Pseudoclavibacter chungangensis TaxID=587635 RepID=A0A7J5BNV7_9MICO|nr:L-lactate dehydrogenase [Pseudoclavibacter chungangensis]KAB1657352.1 L-lactate dehydrogenase [Pseudoclavibacter chungangensis]
MEPVSTSKVAIVGAGSVGATLAYATLIQGLAREVALYDIDAAKVRAEVLDLRQGLQFMPTATVEGSDDIAVCAGADLIAVTAGAKQQPGQSRLDLAASTTGMLRRLMPGLVEVAPEAIIVMVTNPVDVITYAAQQLTGLPAERLFGSGTVLDSSRLRGLIATRCDVAVQNVHAYIVGEHGDSELPLWSTATVGAVPVTELTTAEERDAMAHEVVNAAYEIIRGKGATNYAIGVAASRVIEAVLRDERRVLPVSTRIDELHGITDVCLSMPTIVGVEGAGRRLDVPLSDAELTGLRASADSIRETARGLGF